MATTFQVKRSSVAGKVPNTSTLSIGELGLNLTDQVLYSSNGTGVFELGANVTNQTIKTSLLVGNSSVNTVINSSSISVSSIVANGSVGTDGQILTSNGTVSYWANTTSSGANRTYSVTVVSGIQNTFTTTAPFVTGTTDVYLNGVHLSNSEYLEVNSTAIQLTSDAVNGSVVEVSGWVTVNTLVAGANTTIQFNDSGYINSSSSFTWNKSSDLLTIGNSSVNTTVNSTSVAIGANNLTVGTSLYAVSNGNVGIGTSSPSYPLDVNGNINSSNTIFAVHFDNVSDISLKENILPLNNSINKLNNLYPVSFNWKSTKEQSFGLIAQEVEQILPQIVHQKDDGTKTVSYIQIIALLIDAVKDLQRQIDDINRK